jgi:CHAT domain-containing protein
VDASVEAIRAARKELDDVIEEIRAVPGHEDFLAAPTFEQIAAEAQVGQPLVYFAAADLGGLALVVRGPDVTHVALDRLTADVVRERVTGHLDAYQAYRRRVEGGRARWRKALDDVTAWLWDVAVGPVLDALGDTAEAVFVPGGLLGLLPLHAAWTAGAADGRRRYALDTVTITYVPNARALHAARGHATSSADALVTVTDPPPHVPGRELVHAAIETAVAAAVFPVADVIEPKAATPERVRDGISAATVAHLACHGHAVLETPLDSGLLLADGAHLTLRDLLAMRTNLRLAVLSACETSLPGTDLPDEVVSLPTGLLQAGVGGVIATLWAVPDLASALLMTRFYRAWRHDGVPPPEALRTAQLWLRDTSLARKLEDLASFAADGRLPKELVGRLAGALFTRDPAEDDAHVQAWAAFSYVGA